MIDLTPLDVRKKRGDFSKGLRGYDPGEVDAFLEDVAQRLEDLVRANLRLTERNETLEEQVAHSAGREKAVQEALVTAQALREDVKDQASREAQLIEKNARARIEQFVVEAEQLVRERKTALDELERQRTKFLKSFRLLLERELDTVEVEEGREPLDDVTVELDLGGVWEEAREAASETDVTAADETEASIEEADAPPADEPADVDASATDDAAPVEASESPTEAGDTGSESESEDVPPADAAGSDEEGGGSLWLYDLDEGEKDRG